MAEKSRFDDPKFLSSLPTGGSREFFTASKQFLDKHQLDWVVIEAGSEQHRAWASYFAHKGWQVWFMKKFGADILKKAMFPAEWPEVFDPNYVGPAELPALPSTQISSHSRPLERYQGRRANVLVCKEAPQYARILELIETLDDEDWKHDERGIWISLHYFALTMRESRPLKTPEAREVHLAQAFSFPEKRESDSKLAASEHLVKALKDRTAIGRMNESLDGRDEWPE